jgi:uncharacterized protein YjeT (DUF2065 family)
VLDLWSALGLVLVFEGLVYGGFPAAAKKLARDIQDVPDNILRACGVGVMVLGVGIVWLVRG